MQMRTPDDVILLGGATSFPANWGQATNQSADPSSNRMRVEGGGGPFLELAPMSAWYSLAGPGGAVMTSSTRWTNQEIRVAPHLHDSPMPRVRPGISQPIPTRMGANQRQNVAVGFFNKVHFSENHHSPPPPAPCPRPAENPMDEPSSITSFAWPTTKPSLSRRNLIRTDRTEHGSTTQENFNKVHFPKIGPLANLRRFIATIEAKTRQIDSIDWWWTVTCFAYSASPNFEFPPHWSRGRITTAAAAAAAK